MQFSNRSYFSAMDRVDNAEMFTTDTPAPLDEEGNPIVSDDVLNFTPQEIGLTTNPMQNTLESFKAQIKQGIGRIEFGFMGKGKGNAQNPTPESFGKDERRDMRELLKINDIKTSTHAAVHADSLAGFTNRGFDSATRAAALKEINRAIHFAGEATRGGAIVFHMHEWQRPLSDVNNSKAKFKTYNEEDEEATLFAVDSLTGGVVSDISKNRLVYRPVYETADSKNLIGKKDSKGNILKEGDWIDINGNLIPRDAPPEELFNRVPKFDKDRTNFEVEPITWNKLKEETIRWNEDHPNEPQRTPEQMFAIIEVENKVLQAKGSSLFHAQNYDRHKYERDELSKQYELFKKLKHNTPEEDHWKIEAQYMSQYGNGMRRDEKPEEYFERQIKHTEDTMRHVHEASSSADVQARQLQDMIPRIKSAKEYGLNKTADTISSAGIRAMEVYNKNKDKYELDTPLYAAPENWNSQFYGSHPSEIKDIVLKSREAMVEKLIDKKYSKEEAKKLAETHIKATLDIGHLNTLRENFVGDPKDFEKWMLDETEKLVKDKIVGHIHLSDNFGFDDEHLTPGQGNVPMREFLKRMEKYDMKDLILEVGSFNANTAYLDTFAYTNAPMYGVGARQRFAQTRNVHHGQNAPGFFIAGAYAPSNDWKPWTDLGLE